MTIAVSAVTVGVSTATGSLGPECWVVGDEHDCFVIDVPYAIQHIEPLIDGRRVLGILCTDGQPRHVAEAPAFRIALQAPVLLHPADGALWHQSHPRSAWDVDLDQGQTVAVGDVEIRVMHTPGHTAGAVCFSVPALRCVFTGATLLHGGPRPHGRSYDTVAAQIASIKSTLLQLPDRTKVRTGRGRDTTIGHERLHLQVYPCRRFPPPRLRGEEATP